MRPEYQETEMRGIVLDLPPDQVNPENWSLGINVHFKEGATVRCGGDSVWQPQAGEEVRFLLNCPAPNGTNYWLFCTDSKVWVTDGITTTEVTPTGGIQPSFAWSGDLLNGIPVLNNQLDAPFTWAFDPGTACTKLEGWPDNTLCKSLRATRFHLIAMGITQNTTYYPNLLWWSDAAQPGSLPDTWTPAAGNQAGSVTLGDREGAIIDGMALRDQFLVYKAHSTYAITYIGGTFVFGNQPLFVTSGIVAIGCVTEVDNVHYVLSDTDLIRHDGQQIDSLGSWIVKNRVLGSINPDQYELCQVVRSKDTDEVWFCIPVGGDDHLTEAYIVNTLTKEVGLRALPNVYHVASGKAVAPDTTTTWDADSQAWDDDTTFWDQGAYSLTVDRLLMGRKDEILLVDGSDKVGGQDMFAAVERSGLRIDGRIHQRLLTSVWPRVVGRAGDVLRFRIGGQQYPDDPISWGPTREFVIGSNDRVPCMINKRYLAVHIESTGGAVWNLHGLTLEASQAGVF